MHESRVVAQEAEEERDLTVIPKHRAVGYSFGPQGSESFTLQDGDKIGDVLFEAGSYTLEEVVARCNRDSRTYFARIENKMVRLRKKMTPVGSEALLRRQEVGAPAPRNRAERRKAAALARRARG